MFDLAARPRELLTPAQQELYDGVLADCAHNGETGAVLDRYADMVDEQARDITAVRAALKAAGVTSEAARACLHRPLRTRVGETHPTWCTRPHPPQGPHCSDTATVNQDGAGYACAVLYMWQPPGKPPMVAAELTGDGDDEAHLYLFSIEAVRQLGRVTSQLIQLTNNKTTNTEPVSPPAKQWRQTMA